MLTKHKSFFEPLFDKIAVRLTRIHPHYLTLLSLLFSVVFFIALQLKWYIPGLIFYLGQLFDALDGFVARKTHKVTAFGGFLDSTSDRFSDFFLLAGFGYANLVPWELVVPAIATSFFISYVRSRAEFASSKAISFSHGIMERTERIMLVFIAFFCFLLFPALQILHMSVLVFAFIILVVFNSITLLQRIFIVYKSLHAA
ncbi:MAG TPA: CDP-alcohol phosphatidyltransferase family protein [Patescibacteria group bacterium]|nr:CDP-alcohol phosphatidyltransferase family protein [Patescibacteria group bacterium]